MIDLMKKAEIPDFLFIINTLESKVFFDSSTKQKKLLDEFENDPNPTTRNALTLAIDSEIKYAGAADLAYLVRWIFSDDPGVSADTVIEDVSKKLKVPFKIIGTVEAKLERLVKHVCEKTIFEMPPDEQRKFFEEMDIKPELKKEILDYIKSRGKILSLPVLMNILGKEIVEKLFQKLAVSIIAKYIGQQAAKELLKNLGVRFPWWAEWIGPVAWAISLGWLALDVQGPAFRKTMPITIYLGIVALRDGPEDGKSFWESEVE